MQSEGSCGKDINWKIDAEGNMTVSGTGNGMEYIHTYWDGEEWWTDPTSMDGMRDKIITLCFEEDITEISNLFSGCGNLKKISFPDSLIKIGEAAFSGCENLESVVIPESVRQIDDRAFSGCRKLCEVVCKSEQIQFGIAVFENTLWLESQNDFVILGNVLLAYRGMETIITIPETVHDVARSAFYRNLCIEEVIWSAEVKHVPSGCFKECERLVSVYLPEGVTKIGVAAFFNCRQLMHVDLPESLIEIADKAFWECSSLQEIRLPDNLEKIGWDAFMDCRALKSVRIPAPITALHGTFHGCTDLREVTLGENIKTIGQYTFADCENLKDVCFPKNMPVIEAFAFQQTPIRKVMHFEPEFLIEKSVLEEYRGHGKKVVVPSGVKEIGTFAFAYCNEIEEVILPDEVEVIGQFAFEHCTKLARINFSKSLVEIKDNVFFGCESLKEIIIPIDIGEKGIYVLQKIISAV